MPMVSTMPTVREGRRSSATENDQAWASRPDQQHEAKQMQQPEGPAAQLDQQQEEQAKGRVLGEVGVARM